MSLPSSGRLLLARRRAHRRMDRVAMAHEVGAGGDELFERRINVEEIDIGDEAIDTGVDAGRRLAVQIAARRQQVRQHLQIRKSALVGGVGSIAKRPIPWKW
jgi:hypothetical protein